MQKNTYQTVPILHFSETITKYHAKKRLQCLVVGNFGAYNLPDEAILAGTLADLAKVSHLKVTVAAENPTEVRRLHGSIKTVSLSSIRREIKKSDFVIVAGGGLFKARYLSTLTMLLWKQRVFKKKIYILGLSMSSMTHFAVKLLAYPIIKGATLVTARDQSTTDHLKKNGIHVQMFQDQSNFMDPAPISLVQQDVYFKRFYKKNRLNIGLALHKPVYKKDEKKLLTEITAFVAKHNTEADFWFYASDHHPKHYNDEKFGHVLHEAIKKKIGRDVQFHFIPTLWTPQMFFSSVKLMSCVITMCPYIAYLGNHYNTLLVSIIDKNDQAGFLSLVAQDSLKIADLTSKKLHIKLK
jgi:hypothetical protein